MPPILTIQALRGLAALAVTLSHLVPFEAKHLGATPLVPPWWEFGQAGVDLFFVISGYIMVATTASLQGAGDAGRFLWRRALRIYPLYWAWLLPLIGVAWLAPHLFGSAARGQPSLLASVTLWPHAEGHLLLVSWTLTFELFFYAVFALLLAVVPRRRLGLALGAWAAATLLGQALWRPGVAQPLLNLACNPLVLEFIAGAVLALLLPRCDRRWAWPLLGAGLLLLLLGSLALPGFPTDWRRVPVHGGGSVLLLAGAVLLDPALGPRLPRALVRLGDASFSLYLAHLPAIGVAGLACHALLPAGVVGQGAALTLALGAALLAGLASHHLVERPLQRALRDWPHRAAPVAGWRAGHAVSR